MKKLYSNTCEFKHIYRRESKKIKNLLSNPIFIKEWKETLKTDKEKPIERQKEMKNKQEAFCRKYNLGIFPLKLDNKHFCPVIGPNLHIDEKGKLVWVLSDPLTSIEEKRRLLPEVQQFQDVLCGKPVDHRKRQIVRDQELYDLYYGSDGKKRSGVTYEKISEEYLERHLEVKELYSKSFVEKDIPKEFANVVRVAIKRERDRRKKYK